MDCEKFDEHVIDILYEEIDELTGAALKRHTDSCARCAGILAGLKSAREGAVLQLEEPSPELETRILDAEQAAQKRAPWPRKLMRAAAWAGSHAMRPQLAMAALFMLVVGSSLLLLRARPGTVGAPVEVTERGEPTPAATSTPELGFGARTRSGGKGFDLQGPGAQKAEANAEPKPASPGESDKRPERAADATLSPPAAGAPAALAEATAAASAAPDPVAEGKEVVGANAQQALSWARDGRTAGGCSVALGRYDAVAKRFPSTPEAETASREASECQREVAAAPTQPAKPAAAEMAPGAKPKAPGSADPKP